MNERVMQFRIGMFVIVAGLVLTMLIVWFGESPALFRDRGFLRVRYDEAPGVAEGIPVRKSGIRIGEVVGIEFDTRPHQPDGVIVTMAIERKYPLKVGSVARLSRALIGDVSIDMLPGEGPGFLTLAAHPHDAEPIEGVVAPDPAAALAAATEAFTKAGQVLASFDRAAVGIADVTEKARDLDQVMATLRDAGTKFGAASASVDRLVRANEANFGPALANVRQVSEKFNRTFDEEAQANLKATMDRLATATARLDRDLAALEPVLKDLGANMNAAPVTNIGGTFYRLNRIASNVSLLTAALADKDGRLNRNGTLQRLILETKLYDNYNQLALTARDAMMLARSALASLGKFADRIANDPGAIGRAALQR